LTFFANVNDFMKLLMIYWLAVLHGKECVRQIAKIIILFRNYRGGQTSLLIGLILPGQCYIIK